MDRDALVAILTAENISARRYFFPGGHLSSPHIEITHANELELPFTEKLCSQVLSLPGGGAAASEDTKKICRLLRFIQANATEINAASAARFGHTPSE